MRAEDVAVGTRLRYLGKPFIVAALKPYEGTGGLTGRTATDESGWVLTLHDGYTVWEMEP